MEGYQRLEIEVEGQCDTTLLVNTPSTQWYFDDDSRGNLQPLLNIPAWTGAKILRLQDDGASPATFEELLDLGEVDMAAPATLAQFVDFGVTRFPSRHLGVVIADHGGGWTGIGPDQSSFRAMDVAGVAAGLRAGLEGSAHHNVDLLGFDACYMSTFGGASVLASVADYPLAPGHTWADSHDVLVDLAAELSTVSRTKILSRVGTVVLSRANAMPQRVLLLLE